MKNDCLPNIIQTELSASWLHLGLWLTTKTAEDELWALPCGARKSLAAPVITWSSVFLMESVGNILAGGGWQWTTSIVCKYILEDLFRAWEEIWKEAKVDTLRKVGTETLGWQGEEGSFELEGKRLKYPCSEGGTGQPHGPEDLRRKWVQAEEQPVQRPVGGRLTNHGN